MNPAQIHLMLNHAPLFLSATACLLLAYGLLRGNAPYQRLAYVLLIIGAVAAPVVMLSGHGAEHRVEGLLGVAESRIHAHEEAGESAMMGSVLLGFLAAAQLLSAGLPNAARWRTKGAWVVLIASALAWGWTGWAAHLGGLIRHGAELGSPAPLTAPGDAGGKD